MALDFVKNASNYLEYGTAAFNPFLNGASKIAVSAFINADTYDPDVADNTVIRVDIDSSNVGLRIGITGGGLVRASARSVGTDSQQIRTGTTNIGTGTWNQVGMLVNIGGSIITPIVNGVAESSGAVAFGAATYTPGTPTNPDRIGAGDDTPLNTTDQFDGRIAHVAIWTFSASNADFTVEEWGSLAKFYSPLLIRPNLLTFYEPFLVRRTAPRDSISHMLATINGTLNYADQPRVLMPRKKKVHIWVPGTATFPIGVSTASRHRVGIIRSSSLNIRASARGATGLSRIGFLVKSAIRKAAVSLTINLPLVTQISINVARVATASIDLIRTAARSAFSGAAGLGVHIKQTTRWSRRGRR